MSPTGLGQHQYRVAHDDADFLIIRCRGNHPVSDQSGRLSRFMVVFLSSRSLLIGLVVGASQVELMIAIETVMRKGFMPVCGREGELISGQL